MAIFRFLQRQQSAFGPEDVDLIITAYESALKRFGVRGGVNSFNEMVARYVIEAAQTGEKDPKAMCAAALRRIVKAA